VGVRVPPPAPTSFSPNIILTGAVRRCDCRPRLSRQLDPGLLSNQATRRIVDLSTVGFSSRGLRCAATNQLQGNRRTAGEVLASREICSRQTKGLSHLRHAARVLSPRFPLAKAGRYGTLTSPAGLLGGASGSATAWPAGERPCVLISCANDPGCEGGGTFPDLALE
jgi:hypothetical protein